MRWLALAAMALLVGASILVAAVVELYSEDVRQDCVGTDCVIGYAYQKTWTKVWYDDSARKVVAHTGSADIRSGGIYSFRIQKQAHPSFAGCIGDPWSGYEWMRTDYDSVDWYVLGIYANNWFTQSSISVRAC